MIGIKVKIVPIEAYNSVRIVEHYYRLVRRAYLIIIAEIKGIRISGIVPTLLVYSALPRLSEYNTPAPTISQYSMALKKVIAEIQKL
jgi:hypothetical protein